MDFVSEAHARRVYSASAELATSLMQEMVRVGGLVLRGPWEGKKRVLARAAMEVLEATALQP